MVLTQVEPFRHDLCPGYTSVGYRSKDIWFHTEKALVHVFEPGTPLFISPQIDESESLVSVETCAGLVVCERLYLEMAQFTEIAPDHFIQKIETHSVMMDLFSNLKLEIENKIHYLEFISPMKLPLHCENSASNVPCDIEDKNLSFLRGDLLEVIDGYENFVTYGPVFQCVSQDFSAAPVKHQAVICSSNISDIFDIVKDWVINQINDSTQQIKIDKEENLLTIFQCNEVLAKQREMCIIVELSAIAIIKYKLQGFRDVLKCEIRSGNTLKVASLYPRSHTLDICFIEGPEFDEDQFLYTVWRCLGWWVIKVELFDQYKPENESWRSRGYRLLYRSSKEALSRHAAITLHQSVLADILITSQLAEKVL